MTQYSTSSYHRISHKVIEQTPEEQASLRITSLLSRKLLNQQRFALQLIKGLYLFPDQSISSSQISVSKYDSLLFSDEKLHSLTKIMETQLIARKIWSFINLKVHRKVEMIR